MVTLADDVRQALPELRLQAESMMVDRADIVRSAGVPVFNPATGLLESSETTVYTDRPCWLRMPTTMETERLFGEEQVTTTRYVACFAYDTFGVQIGDVIRLTECEDVDALLREYRVVVTPTRTVGVLKNFGCETVE